LARSVQLWLAVSGSLAAGLLVGARQMASRPLPLYERPVLAIARGEGLALLALVLLVAFTAAGWRDALPAPGAPAAARVRARPYATLFVVSFVALFVELLLIRYANGQIRIFSFYKNVPLIGCFLGLGMGCCLARGGRREALLVLLWMVPVAVFLTGGSLLLSNALGKLAAVASSEQILGDYIKSGHGGALASQIAIAGFCVATLVVITLLFGLLGRLLGEAFEHVARVPGYTVNIAGSLAGILGFSLLSLLETPPWQWVVVGLLPLVWWLARRSELVLALALVGLVSAAVAPSYGDTVWSRYQKLVGHHIDLTGRDLSDAYLVDISDVFYQVAVDRSPEGLRRLGRDPFPHYGAIWATLARPQRVLVVGAGTGNDVAAALRAGAERVDAVDIDPAIVEMGRRFHPEHPYDDPRVHVIIDDARHAFRVLPAGAYDAVLFGLLDSHSQLGMSSLRLDNYVFTVESLREAKRLVRPGGHLVVSAAVFRPWFRERFAAMLAAVSDGPVHELHERREAAWWTWIGPVGEAGAKPVPVAATIDLPSDDWPFLYLPERTVPTAYLLVVGAMAIASVLVLRAGGLQLGRFTAHHAHLFFLGAAFLLMEVHAINRLALLFGTTWLVSAVTIGLVLLLIVLANFAVMAFARIPYALAYGGLAASLALSFALQPESVLGAGRLAQLAFGVALLSPVYFAGLVFARSFSLAELAAPAMGANILGSVVGGWVEYSTMAVGMRALVLLAAAFYAFSLLALWAHAGQVAAQPAPARPPHDEGTAERRPRQV
jgi:SAM-dependent methyltransferase